jgi:hypothetical protein
LILSDDAYGFHDHSHELPSFIATTTVAEISPGQARWSDTLPVATYTTRVWGFQGRKIQIYRLPDRPAPKVYKLLKAEACQEAQGHSRPSENGLPFHVKRLNLEKETF